ncbi:hypothetical protein [Schlesneria paludicola]|uniref:hypothetical protein n=1 Tax=Schlesneria paludicola TaxID=360056 RepID=UPI00029B456D|nr:hypothetical protein [Schlesneria paludicola]
MQSESFANVLDQSTVQGFHTSANQAAFDEHQTPDLTQLLDRCRGDLIFVDSLLCELESIQRPERGRALTTGSRSDAIDPSWMPRAFATGMTTIGADLIRRLADDIEDLCRTSARGTAHEMLLDLQVKMVRCLQMLPATSNIINN